MTTLAYPPIQAETTDGAERTIERVTAVPVATGVSPRRATRTDNSLPVGLPAPRMLPDRDGDKIQVRKFADTVGDTGLMHGAPRLSPANLRAVDWRS